MLSFMWWLIIGIVAGFLARALVPGRQSMGLLMTMVLGLAGSLIGGFLTALLFGTDPADPGIQASGLIGSTIGAVIALVLYAWMSRERSSV